MPLNRELTNYEYDNLYKVASGDMKIKNFGIFENKIVCLDYA